MPLFTKESLETLRQRIDLIEVMAPHIEFKRSGTAYKALCPFHDEKTPSFMIQKGDHHYHCFGCGAHGDAIQFLMTHLKMSFMEAVESLAQRFNVPLEHAEKGLEPQGPNKTLLKKALDQACQLFHFYLLNSLEGQQALHYLYSRGIDLDFIKYFQIGLSSKSPGVLRKVLHAHSISDEIMVEAGLLSHFSSGGCREFFQDRIMFPIRDPQGAVIAFSGRKYKEETFGGKYVNTSETPLFKKSRVLFGLNYCRKRIAKERKALIVEGQLDALRLIYNGFNIAVAGQGTAFGEGHAKELINLGVNQIYLATDADEAGSEAACKIGNLFQREGIEVLVLPLPTGADPDSFLMEQGPEAFEKLMLNALSYLEFLVKHHTKKINLDSPAGKNELVQMLAKQIRDWNHPLMVHESLRKLAHLIQIPEATIGLEQEAVPNIFIKRADRVGMQSVDSDRILEYDILRWLLLVGGTQENLITLVEKNLNPKEFKVGICREILSTFLENYRNKQPRDLLAIMTTIEDPDIQPTIEEILQRKINKERAEQQLIEAVQRILDRNWMEQCEQIRLKIQDGQCSDDEASELIKQFTELKRNQPKVII